MSFYCEFTKDGVEVGHTFLAALFLVAGKGELIDERIKYIGKDPKAILISPEGKRKVLPPQEVTNYIKDAGYTWDGAVLLPDQRPQVIFRIKGNMELFKKIYDGFGKEGGLSEEAGVPNFILSDVDQKTAFLKGLAVHKRRQYYARIGDKEFLEEVEVY